MSNTGISRRVTNKRLPQRSPGITANRPRSGDKNVTAEGVYANQRYTHGITSLVGSTVQVQVKNGSVYDGILATFSPKMEIVLECAHRISNEPSSPSNTPSREQLVDKVLFNLNDVVSMTATNVDLEFPIKDAFTDAAIAGKLSVNGEKEMKELQPWVADSDSIGLALDSTSGMANGGGWDPDEMFKTNEEKFNVNTTYDSNLTQYTTSIQRNDSAEFRKREANAARLAAEIEGQDTYKKRADLENGDEEELYSSVQRPSHKPISPEDNLPDGSIVGGKYVPPHKRPNPPANPPGRGIRSGNASPVQPSYSGSSSQLSSPGSTTQTIAGTPSKLNGASVSTSDSSSSESATSGSIKEPIQETSGQRDPANTAANRVGEKRDAAIADLKAFGENFKLSDQDKNASKENMADDCPPSAGEDTALVSESGATQLEAHSTKSKLNPNAQVFNPKAKPFQPKTTPTPPRPPSQSSSPQFIPVAAGQVAFPGPGYTLVQPQQNLPGMQQPNKPQMPKQITVPLSRAELNGQPGATAAQVTGQPLLAQPTQFVQYNGGPVLHPLYAAQQPQQGGYPQVLHYQSRMINPQAVMVQSSQPNEHGNGHGPQTMYVPSQQPMPAHMANHPGMHPHPTPAHMSAHQVRPAFNQQQGSPLNGPNGHPAQAPAHQAQINHPPTSVTPQPQMVYTQTNNQVVQPQQGPPLQPSPHTPASPQAHPPSAAFPNYPAYPGQYPYVTWPQQTGVQQTMAANQNSHMSHGSQQAAFVMLPPQSAQQGSSAPPGSAPQFQGPPQIGSAGQLTAPHVQAGNLPGHTMLTGSVPQNVNASSGSAHQQPSVQYFVHNPNFQHQ